MQLKSWDHETKWNTYISRWIMNKSDESWWSHSANVMVSPIDSYINPCDFLLNSWCSCKTFTERYPIALSGPANASQVGILGFSKGGFMTLNVLGAAWEEMAWKKCCWCSPCNSQEEKKLLCREEEMDTFYISGSTVCLRLWAWWMKKLDVRWK